MDKKRYTAIVLSAGSGKRMKSDVPKQYLLLEGRPVLFYALEAFEKSMVDDVIIVCGEHDVDYCKKEIVQKYHFEKVRAVVSGGKERYDSVFCGLKAAKGADYVMIHDGARPFVTEDMILRLGEAVQQYQACVAAMPVKDTIKIADEKGFARETPPRSLVWMIQTPQVFSYELIYRCYDRVLKTGDTSITDDAMVVEKAGDVPVKLIPGRYENIKITTPEDLLTAAGFLKNSPVL